MWCGEVAESVDRIKALSFLEYGEDRLQRLLLTPTMINYIHNSIDNSSKKNIMDKICEFYSEILQKCYSIIGKKDSSKNSMTNESENKKSPGNIFIESFISQSSID